MIETGGQRPVQRTGMLPLVTTVTDQTTEHHEEMLPAWWYIHL
jgi:hypothetical protein